MPGRYFYFEVNGAPIFAKGSNFIPAHTMPELGTNPQVAEHLLRSSAEANHNMLRVWGGGVYETDFFYQVNFNPNFVIFCNSTQYLDADVR